MNLREMVVNGAIEEMKTILEELKEELYRAETIEATLTIAEEMDDVRASIQDAKLHYNHYVQYGFIYQ